MKILARTLVIVLLVAGCARQSQNSNLSGKWRGSVTENGKSTSMELPLLRQQLSLIRSLNHRRTPLPKPPDPLASVQTTYRELLSKPAYFYA